MKRQRFSTAAAMAIALGLAGAMTGADTITIDGETHHDVYVREGGAMYYVQLPATGEVFSVSRDRVAPEDVSMHPDAAHRASLLAEWRANREEPVTRRPARDPVAALENARENRPESASGNPGGDNSLPPLQLRGAARESANPTTANPENLHARLRAVSDGRVPYIRLQDIPLGEALKALLRSQNLDYVVRDNYIYISTPDRLRREALDPVQTRIYRYNNLGQTLPKVVVRNQAQTFGGGVGAPGGFGGQRGGLGQTGGFGQMGMGGQQGFGQMGGMGGQQGFGQMGGQMGGFGGQMGGMGGRPDVTAISNISDMFTTIDDRLVGETPAVIGMAYAVRPGENRQAAQQRQRPAGQQRFQQPMRR